MIMWQVNQFEGQMSMYALMGFHQGIFLLLGNCSSLFYFVHSPILKCLPELNHAKKYQNWSNSCWKKSSVKQKVGDNHNICRHEDSTKFKN